MNDHALRVLEYDKVREIVSRFAASEPGSRRVLALRPSPDGAEAAQRLAATRALMQLQAGGEQPPLDGIRDVAPALERLAAPGVMLQPAELLDLASTLAAGRRVKAFAARFAAAGAGRESAPLLARAAAAIVPLKQFEDAVHRAVDESGEVKDGASPELRRLRKLIGRTREEILDRMGRILRDAEARNLAQEQVITVRDDRYVIPLKPGFRQAVKGVVHGRSGSRATLFVEPLEVLEQNNRLAELRMEEQAEVERILRELSSMMAGEREAADATFDALTAIDAVNAAARFGAACRAAVPALAEDRRLRLRAARHPLLVWKAQTAPGGGQVVPNDIDLSRDQKVLIISGPNAGGKTALLKTVGLLCLMAQSGLPVTAGEGSELPVLSDVFADIGDEQSLEQDLSTFSSHAGRIAGILREADRGALVLLDELGSGTDPAEGAALGSAVLAKLLAKGCVTVVTTHHSTLKLFGAETSGAVNSAMEFDPATLRPTYRFVPGRPGRSYGLDMAERHGVPDGVIRDARARLRSDEAALDRLLARIEQDALVLRQSREQAEADSRAAASLRSEALALQQAARTEAAEAKQQARQESREVLATLRQKLKDLSRTAAISRDEARAGRQEADELARRLEPPPLPEPEGPSAAAADVRPGDRVSVPRLNRTGTVLFVHRDELEIDAGGVKLRLPVRETVLIDAATEQRTAVTSGWSADLEERAGAADRVNLLGMRVDEALAEVERFIDRAGYQNVQQVTVIHGLGTGALKTAVAEYLKGHALVASLRPGEPAEGGAGVTVAELKR